MNQRDLSELKRRLNPDKRNPTVIRGCYVGHDGHVISTFVQPVFNMPQEENEKYMAIFKRTLSGTLGQNLLNVEFSASQAMDGDEHHLLSALRDSALKDEAAVDAFYQRVIDYLKAVHEAGDTQSVSENQEAENHLILMMHDGYDVPYKNQNDETDREQSFYLFNYIICSVCPVRQTKPVLSYYAAENEFHSRMLDWVVSAPNLGFLFPAYEERSANIYSALYYTRDISDLNEAFMERVFHTDSPMPPAQQKETFQAILQESLADECSLDLVQAVHETVRSMVEERKADKTAEPLSLDKREMREVLESCGVSSQRAESFEKHYGETFGEYAQLPAVNLTTPKQFKVDAPGVSIRVDPERSDLIETRIIDGRRYILVLADGDVEVNGVNVKF